MQTAAFYLHAWLVFATIHECAITPQIVGPQCSRYLGGIGDMLASSRHFSHKNWQRKCALVSIFSTLLRGRVVMQPCLDELLHGASCRSTATPLPTSVPLHDTGVAPNLVPNRFIPATSTYVRERVTTFRRLG